VNGVLMVKRWVLTTLVLLVLGMSHAQGSYVGIGGSVITASADGIFPLLGLQVGGPVAETLELCGTLDTLLFLSTLGADLLYPFAVLPTLEGCAGGGADFAFLFTPVSTPRVRRRSTRRRGSRSAAAPRASTVKSPTRSRARPSSLSK
jgi:hypothetical protein